MSVSFCIFSHGDGVSFPQKMVDEVSGGLLDERTNWVEDETDDTGKVAFGNLYESGKLIFNDCQCIVIT